MGDKVVDASVCVVPQTIKVNRPDNNSPTWASYRGADAHSCRSLQNLVRSAEAELSLEVWQAELSLEVWWPRQFLS